MRLRPCYLCLLLFYYFQAQAVTNPDDLTSRGEQYIRSVQAQVTVDKNGEYTLQTILPIKHSISPENALKLLTENENLLKASDTFTKALSIENTSDGHQIFTSKILISHIIPDKVQVSCTTENPGDSIERTCDMTALNAMTNKFKSYRDIFECSQDSCTITSVVTLKKGMLTFSKIELAAILDEKALRRSVTMGFLINHSSANNYQRNGDFFRTLKLYIDQVDNLDEYVENLTHDIEKGKCSKLEATLLNGLRQKRCVL